MSTSYSVNQISKSQLPTGLDPEEFSEDPWATSLNGKVVAVCFDEQLANAIADRDLARPTVQLGQPKWFSIKLGGDLAGFCLGSVLPGIEKQFGRS